MPPQGLINDEDEQEKLSGDYSSPFSAPSGALDTTDDTHPEADSNVDAHEHYDEGISGATEVVDPGDQGIVGFNPPPVTSTVSDDDEDDSEEE
ncbi:MAG: hypothetical protein JWO96_213 [Candidatus Saccharibacteria bacterium]|nr:hypothetical protein [Candidatus Saccharibacteria bacterium]